MTLSPRFLWLFTVAVAAVFAGAQPASASESLADAAFLASFGRLPQPAEKAGSLGGLSFAEQLATLATRLANDPNEQRQVVARSFRDAFGRTPTPSETTVESPAGYTDLMRRHVARLAQDDAEFDAVLHRAYRLVISRDIYPEEIKYWRQVGVVPFALLVASIDDWARRNQPGLMVTGGTPTVSVNCEYLTTARVRPEDASTLRQGLELGAPTAEGRNVVAIGGAPLLSSGGIAFIAVGSPRLDDK